MEYMRRIIEHYITTALSAAGVRVDVDTYSELGCALEEIVTLEQRVKALEQEFKDINPYSSERKILNHYIWLEQQINDAVIGGDKRRNQALRESREALSSEIEHSQIYENLAYIDSLIRHHSECENQAAWEISDAANDPGLLNDLNAAAQYHSEKKEEAMQEWQQLLQQLKQVEAGGKQ
jgi:hypothetical protein